MDTFRSYQWIFECLIIFAISPRNAAEPITILSPTYGGSGGTAYSALNQGRISGMSHWGIGHCCSATLETGEWALYIRSWTSDGITGDQTFGQEIGSATPCTSFNLTNDDYITGFQVYYGTTGFKLVRGLIFNTLKGYNHSCFVPNIDTFSNDAVSYYTGIDDFYYLTGWKGTHGGLIDSIQLQFTKYTEDTNNNTNKYIAVTQSVNWQEAEDYCINTFNTHLASIHSDSDNDEVHALCDSYCYIGFNDISSEGTWVWSDSSSNDFTNWAILSEAEPNGDGDCVAMWVHPTSSDHDAHWNDGACTDIVDQFICNGLNETVASNPPTYDPTMEPTTGTPTNPTMEPTVNPTVHPTIHPTFNPTSHPTFDPTNDPTESITILSSIYGGSGGTAYSALNQGRISGMLDWGIAHCCSATLETGEWAMYIRSWTSDGITGNQTFGEEINNVKPCTSFNLTNDDYITGFKVYYGTSGFKFCRGLIFDTLKGYNYSCLASNIDDFSNDAASYYTGIDDFYYLTGWKGAHGALIDSIQLQFTKYTEDTNNKYIAVTQSVNWQEAENYCINTFNTHLASIHSDSDNDEVHALCDSYCYIGFNDISSEGAWVWSDSSLNVFTKWATLSVTEPSGDGDCVAMWVHPTDSDMDAHWNDGACTDIVDQFICNAFDGNETVPNPTNPTVEPTINPTVHPTMHPSADPTTQPTKDPTSNPTIDPTYTPTKNTVPPSTKYPTADPTIDPTIYPIIDPTRDPSSDPTSDPSIDPTHDPTLDPTTIPSKAPLSIAAKLSNNVDNASDKYKVFIYGALVVIPLLLLIIVLIVKYTSVSAKIKNVDDQDNVCFILFLIQIFDVYSDVIFALQLYAYYSFGKLIENDIPSDATQTFFILFILSVVFTVVPYIANFISSHRIVISVMDSDSISEYTKDYFRKNSSIYSIGVLLSGGSYPTLRLLNSNFLGIKKFSAGLSVQQIKRFEFHKLYTTSLLENMPQLVIQSYFIWHLNLVTDTVVISLILSVFNILLSILSTSINKTTHKQNEFPFEIVLTDSNNNNNNQPFIDIGRRHKLALNLKAETANSEKRLPFNFEFLSFDENTKILYGVVLYSEPGKEKKITAFLSDNIQIAVDKTCINSGLKALYKNNHSTRNIETNLEMHMVINDLERSNYLNWTQHDLIHWIIGLDDGLYKQYQQQLGISFKNDNIDGSCLPYADKSDIKKWGVTDFKHRSSILTHIKHLQNNQDTTQI